MEWYRTAHLVSCARFRGWSSFLDNPVHSLVLAAAVLTVIRGNRIAVSTIVPAKVPRGIHLTSTSSRVSASIYGVQLTNRTHMLPRSHRCAVWVSFIIRATLAGMARLMQSVKRVSSDGVLSQ
jgi:hypothetical protein